MRYYFKFASALLLSSLFACSNDDVLVNEDRITEWNIQIEASKTSEGISRALSVDGNNINAVWSTDESVVAVNHDNSNMRYGSLSPKTEGKNAVLTGTLTGDLKTGDIIDLYFPATVYDSESLVFDYSSQDGTIASLSKNLDFSKASVTITDTDAEKRTITTTDAIFSSQQAIAGFQFTDVTGRPLSVKSLVISSNNNTLVSKLEIKDNNPVYTYGQINVTLATATRETVYIAIRNTSETADTYNFNMVDEYGEEWIGSATATLLSGKFYPGTLKLNVKNDYTTFSVSEVKPSLISEDHTSEGFLTTMPDGRIYHFFRMDKGLRGDHVSSGGALYKRYTDDNAETWSTPECVFDDLDYDDRNLGGGLTDDGKIIIFFRRYNVTTATTQDVDYIISSDNGQTFSERKVLPEITRLPLRFASLGNGEYICPIYDNEQSLIKTFKLENDEVVFSSESWLFPTEHILVEPDICVNGNTVLCILRSEIEGVYQSYSVDKGKTFTEPVLTTLVDGLRISFPCLLYDKVYTDNVWFIVGDRRKENKESAKLWIYNNTFSEACENVNNFNLFKTLERPIPSNFKLYAYPVYTLMNNGKYLIVFTESYNDGYNENADFYQFTFSPSK